MDVLTEKGVLRGVSGGMGKNKGESRNEDDREDGRLVAMKNGGEMTENEALELEKYRIDMEVEKVIIWTKKEIELKKLEENTSKGYRTCVGVYNKIHNIL